MHPPIARRNYPRGLVTASTAARVHGGVARVHEASRSRCSYGRSVAREPTTGRARGLLVSPPHVVSRSWTGLAASWSSKGCPWRPKWSRKAMLLGQGNASRLGGNSWLRSSVARGSFTRGGRWSSIGRPSPTLVGRRCASRPRAYSASPLVAPGHPREGVHHGPPAAREDPGFGSDPNEYRELSTEDEDEDDDITNRG
ncbi:hypothetical protein Dimus_022949 [Dionaea muscipula]